jgi:hypothetical protein
MVISAGKSRQNVDAYVLIPPNSKEKLELLLRTRRRAGIRDTNCYRFPRQNADSSLSGNTEMRELVDECPGLKYPQRISSKYLRRYIATLSQVICLAHSAPINIAHYRYM